MCGKNRVRYILAFILGVVIVIAVCSFALASASSTPPVISTSPSSTPTSSIPASSAPKSVVKAAAAPSITSIDFKAGRPGDLLLIQGKGFGAVQESSYVSFGTFKSTIYSAWDDALVYCAVPSITGVEFPVTAPVTVTTSNGTSNLKSFTILEPMSVTGITPSNGYSSTRVDVKITGSGFLEGSVVRLKLDPTGDSTIPTLMSKAFNTVVVSDKEITCSFTLPSSYIISYYANRFHIPPVFNVEVSTPSYGSKYGAVLRHAFDVSINPNMCGIGAVGPIIGFALAMGIFIVAGTFKRGGRVSDNIKRN